MGFSPLGLMVSLGVLAPNLLLAWLPLRAPLPSVRVPAPLRWLERAGQALCMVVPAITTPGNVVWWWVLPVVGGLACYYVLWGRYLADGR